MKPGNYRLRSPEISLQKLTAARIDLRIADEMLEHCVDTDGGLHDECEQLEEACWTTAAIRYRRCFNSRTVCQIALSELTDEQFELHHYFCYLRDKMFSHDVGIGQDFEVTAYVAGTLRDDAQLVAVSPRPRRISSPGSDLAKEFLALVRQIRPKVEAAFEQETAVAVRRLRTLPLREVVRGEPIDQSPIPRGRDQPGFQSYLREGKARTAPNDA